MTDQTDQTQDVMANPHLVGGVFLSIQSTALQQLQRGSAGDLTALQLFQTQILAFCGAIQKTKLGNISNAVQFGYKNCSAVDLANHIKR